MLKNMTGAAMALSFALSATAYAAGEHKHGHGDAKDGHGGAEHADIGRPGDPAKVDRTIEIIMRDTAYEPAGLEIREGETVRFVVTNAGQLVHEFNIGTAAMHGAHQAEMQAMVDNGILEADRIRHDRMRHGEHGMHHDHANSVLLEPGQSGEVIWTFDTHSRLEFACNVPGHYEAGMKGDFHLHH
ncbi:MAG: cupredoxin domain-containing protein [Pseudomonadota bacterium]|nr:cupredoxin domain-containing protein [Pseudomonadota bacterium]